MAEIHSTTMNPTKLELLTQWLPAQPWYVPAGDGPELAKAGGFRLDDPDGDVGIEFLIVADSAPTLSVVYLVPLTYRGAPVDGLEEALIGTSEHGVLGRRWIYDGVRDPVLVAQLTALLRGEVVAQHQNRSHETDPSVVVDAVEAGGPVDVSVLRELAASVPEAQGRGQVTATWQLPDGTSLTGPVALAEPAS